MVVVCLEKIVVLPPLTDPRAVSTLAVVVLECVLLLGLSRISGGQAAD